MVIYSVYDSELTHKVINPFGYILNVTFPLLFITVGYINHNNWKMIMFFNALVLAIFSFYIAFFKHSIDPNSLEHNKLLKIKKDNKINQIEIC